LIKKFPEFIQKIQNISFIHQKWYCPLQSTLHRLQLMPALDPALKHFWNSIVGSHQSHLRFFHYLLSAVKRVPRNGFLTRSNRKKSQGAISGEFDDCWMLLVSFLVKNSRIMMALCDGALSWCKIHELFSHKSKIENTCRGRYTQDDVTFTNVKLWW